MVMVLFAHVAVTPAGNPVGVPIPVAPEVVWVIEKTVLMHIGNVRGGPTVLEVMTVIVPVAFTVPQPPINGME